MRLPIRAVLAAVAVAGLATATPGFANHEDPPYECVTYPCYPEDWVEVLTRGEVTIEDRGAYNCVTEPCPQPVFDHQVCVTRLGACV